jgi:molybdopterin-binding protein
MEVRILKDGQVVAKVAIEYAEGKEVVEQIITELTDVGDIEVWHEGLFVALISSKN